MKSFLKRLAVRKKGMEALQAVLIVVVAFFIVLVLKDQGRKYTRSAGDQGDKITKSLEEGEPTGEPR
jgi:hypothetical protein